jgi:hypothetical protein
MDLGDGDYAQSLARWEAQLQEPKPPHRATRRDVYRFPC